MEKKLNKKVLDKFPVFLPHVNDKMVEDWNFNIFKAKDHEKHRLIWTMFNNLGLPNKYEIP